MHTRDAESPTTLTPFSLAMLTAPAVHTEADSGMTAFIRNNELFENSSLTLAVVAMLLVFSDIVLEASDIDTPSLAEIQRNNKE